MKLSQFVLLKLSEECVEVAHRASKQIQFGPDETQRGETETNSERLKGEILDLLSIVRLLILLGQIGSLTGDELETAFQNKVVKLDKYLDLSEELGEIQIND